LRPELKIWFFSNLFGKEGPRIRGVNPPKFGGGKGLFSKDFISAFNILSISAMSFFAVLNSPFSMKPKSPANNIWISFFEYLFAFHLNPWTLDLLDPSVVF
jgi:hypothetical protein